MDELREKRSLWDEEPGEAAPASKWEIPLAERMRPRSLEETAGQGHLLSGDAPLASVRTDRPIPLARIMDVMEEIRKVTVDAPVEIGAVVLSRPAGCDTDIIVTRSVRRPS